MNLTHAATAAVLAGVTLGLAAPASANETVSMPKADLNALGTYTFEGEDGQSATWTVTPCADDNFNCVNVAEAGNSSRAPWSANAYRSVGYWILFVGQPDAVLCADGAAAPGLNNYSWDSAGLTGYTSISDASGCGTPPENLAIPFALTKTGSGPVQLPDAPIIDEPYIVNIPEPYVPGAAEAPPAATPAESDPALTETPRFIPNASEPLTEAEVAEPGFNR